MTTVPGASKSTVTIAIAEWPSFWIKIAKSLGATHPTAIDDKTSCYCASCGGHFTQEALNMLNIVDMFSPGAVVVRNATVKGNALRSGQCPECGHDKMRVVVEDGGRLQASCPKAVACVAHSSSSASSDVKSSQMKRCSSCGRLNDPTRDECVFCGRHLGPARAPGPPSVAPDACAPKEAVSGLVVRRGYVHLVLCGLMSLPFGDAAFGLATYFNSHFVSSLRGAMRIWTVLDACGPWLFVIPFTLILFFFLKPVSDSGVRFASSIIVALPFVILSRWAIQSLAAKFSGAVFISACVASAPLSSLVLVAASALFVFGPSTKAEERPSGNEGNSGAPKQGPSRESRTGIERKLKNAAPRPSGSSADDNSCSVKRRLIIVPSPDPAGESASERLTASKVYTYSILLFGVLSSIRSDRGEPKDGMAVDRLVEFLKTIPGFGEVDATTLNGWLVHHFDNCKRLGLMTADSPIGASFEPVVGRLRNSKDRLRALELSVQLNEWASPERVGGDTHGCLLEMCRVLEIPKESLYAMIPGGMAYLLGLQ